MTSTEPSSSFTPSRSIIGPLTTTFTPPSHCSEVGLGRFADGYGVLSAWVAMVGVVSSGNNFPTNDDRCWPSATRISSQDAQGWGIYSPGLICPAGYTTACTSAPAISNWRSSEGFEFMSPVLPGETAAGCCPRYALPEGSGPFSNFPCRNMLTGLAKLLVAMRVQIYKSE